MENKNKPSKEVIYLAPDSKLIDRYAREVCSGLAERTGNTNYVNSDVVYGLADFLKIVSEILVKQLNAGNVGLLDSE